MSIKVSSQRLRIRQMRSQNTPTLEPVNADRRGLDARINRIRVEIVAAGFVFCGPIH